MLIELQKFHTPTRKYLHANIADRHDVAAVLLSLEAHGLPRGLMREAVHALSGKGQPQWYSWTDRKGVQVFWHTPFAHKEDGEDQRESYEC